MHHVKFNIFLSAQISAHTTEYTVVKQLILILMRVPTKLLCIKQYLHTPCAPYYVCAYHARLILVHASTHNNLPRDTTIYRTHWHANGFPRGAKFTTHAQYANLFQGHSMTLILVTSKLLFCEYSLQLHPSGPSKLSVELRL
jgi:hypothetical protein